MNPALYSIARRFLFQMNPEAAHGFTLSALRMAENLRLLSLVMSKMPMDPVKVMGIEFPNRVGLAAGMDKEADTVDAFSRMGFGFVEVGTLTPKAQPGNERPRSFRLVNHKALINRMGFNNHGIEQGVLNLGNRHLHKSVLGVNIGKNKVTPNELADHDYLTCLRAAWPVADYIAINLSSPNTPGLRALQAADSVAKLLSKLKTEQENLSAESGRYVPLALKVAPDLTDDEIKSMSRVFVDGGLDCLIATNTTLDRSAVLDHPLHNEAGGLSGAPVTKRSTEVIAAFHSYMGSELPIIGVGGIMSGDDAVDKLKAGASLVQLYTGFIYKGPALIAECVEKMKAYSRG